MKKRLSVMVGIGASFASLIYACSQSTKAIEQKEPIAAEQPDSQALVQRGAYLVTTMGCNDCHTPKLLKGNAVVLDSSRLLSGYPSERPLPEFNMQEIMKGQVIANMDFTAVAGPWGTTFSANLTPDATGIGTWSEAQFANALRHGKFKGLDEARMLMPPMPWQNFVSLSDADLGAIFSYLQSTKPVHNLVPAFRPLNHQ